MNTKAQAPFPSTAWFQSLREEMNSQQAKYKSLGFADSRAVFTVGADAELKAGRSFGVVFEVYDCLEVRELGKKEIEQYDPDWILEGPYCEWKAMIENIKAKGSADSDYTLNRLSLLQLPFRQYGSDQTRVDLFFRQQFSFQEFIDGSAAVETVFAP